MVRLVSSSPIVGQTQVNVDLEKALQHGDLILCDALNHDSVVSGHALAAPPFCFSRTITPEALERMLSRLRMKYRRVLVVIEGVYSMDGDIPDVREMVRIKKKHKALLFIDEAHPFGTMEVQGAVYASTSM
ncbi:unnamed protein product [Peronospora belbahrii]|uniref:Aminotransferase class I/classII large domain-containing protein n=1 Tax=Peronospora belbahrii TaxID=622444 RepID=A0ABN8CVP0_9STRA|nr:unnamed protein product [Peronospora belbahrii]